MNDIRRRLIKALHPSATLPALREELVLVLVLVLCDLDEQDAAPTLRGLSADAYGHNESPDTERDSAPPTPVDSQLGQEYGP